MYNKIYTINMLLNAGSSEGDAYSHFSWLLLDDSHVGGREYIRCRWVSLWNGDEDRFFKFTFVFG